MSGTIESKVITPSGGAVQGTAVLSAGPVSSGQLLAADGAGGAHWITASGTGTVTSIGVITDTTTVNIFANSTNNLTGSPVTTAGNITLTLSTQTQNKFLASPNGSTGAPTFRAIVAADVPTLNQNTTGTAANVTGSTNSTITTLSSLSLPTSQLSGTITGAQLPTFTGDVTNSSAAMTVAKIAGVAVGTPTGTTNVVFSDSPTFTTKLTFGNYHLEPSENNAGNSSTAQTIDWSTGSAQKSTLTGSVTYTFTNPVTGGAYVLKIATGAGSFTVTWPATVKWSGGTAPTITTTASKTDLINFYWDGTNYFGSFVQNF